MTKKKWFILISSTLITAIAVFAILQLPYFQLNSEQREKEEALREQITPEETENEEETPEESEEVMGDVEEQENTPIAVDEDLENTFEFASEEDVDIVALGDSLTQGVGDDTDQGGYVGILDRTLQVLDTNVHFQNFGKRGNRTDQLLHRLEEEPALAEALEEADMIIITIGANDIMQVLKENIMDLEISYFNEEQTSYEERLHEIFDTIRSLNEDASIYLLGIFNPFKNYFEDIPELDQIVLNWNDIGREIVSENENSTFVPIDDLFDDDAADLFAEDNFHPNYDGYYLMAERILEYFN
ncbi:MULTISPECIES: SGNH/GDSL hydrolase family protein [Oceanobacillus]|nr:SGNH/GDSL hydrolase family protein [Oceanobacillus oncorhynchi]MDM8098907.1 SGNH/GDSL hydrolase family protein [Oceanobacillus oncorhynchi]UUI39689.1 SGNH/GDSL hydrolase family protein [Oceanobacillus oncorhynchi]